MKLTIKNKEYPKQIKFDGEEKVKEKEKAIE